MDFSNMLVANNSRPGIWILGDHISFHFKFTVSNRSKSKSESDWSGGGWKEEKEEKLPAQSAH